MIFDKEMLDILKKSCRKCEYDQIVIYEKLFDNLKTYIDNDLKRAKTKNDADRIENYFNWAMNWLNNDMRMHTEYLVKKGIIMNIFDKSKKLTEMFANMFSEERMQQDLDTFAKDIEKRSVYYARENAENGDQ